MWCWAVRDLRHNVVHTCSVGGRCWWQYYRISVGFRILSLYMEDSRDRQYTTCFLPTWYRELMTMWMLYFKWLFFLSKKMHEKLVASPGSGLWSMWSHRCFPSWLQQHLGRSQRSSLLWLCPFASPAFISSTIEDGCVFQQK